MKVNKEILSLKMIHKCKTKQMRPNLDSKIDFLFKFVYFIDFVRLIKKLSIKKNIYNFIYFNNIYLYLNRFFMT